MADQQPNLSGFDGVSSRKGPGLNIAVPEPIQPYLRIGTCSWKYDSWKGLLYDPNKTYRPDDYLSDYAQHLNTVEIDQWFWSLFPTGVKLPEAETVKQYAESVPDDFRFTVKVPNAITLTNYYSRQPQQYAEFANRQNNRFLDVDLLQQFLERLSPMGGKLGPILFQFEYLNQKKMPSLSAFLEHLSAFFDEVPDGFQYAVEIRNPNYLSPEFFSVLTSHGVGFVYLEGYFMPHIGEVWDQFQPATADFAVIRLHGPDRSDIEKRTGEKWDRIVDPKPEGLEATARIIRANASRKIKTFVNVNNHFEGSAPLTIERLLAQVGKNQ